MKAEAGAQRIFRLESEVNELYVHSNTTLTLSNPRLTAFSCRENESAKDQSELTFLKLNLRMLEIQADPYIPKDDRDGLREGIRRWKLDWADVDQRRRARRKKTLID